MSLASKTFLVTLRENVKDEDSNSSNYLVRSGCIAKIGSGIYAYLPIGLRIYQKIEQIVREEMNQKNAEELIMPSLIPMTYYEKSGRKEKFGPSMFQLKDRYERDYALGPTHEELFAFIAKKKIHSYKDMPFTLYQMANKYRDEARPRYGLIRVREFVMKDAYSFDKDDMGCDQSYMQMKQAYNTIFDRLHIQYRIVKADNGTMGGSLSEEYQAITDIGEDEILLCDHCDYAANKEVATCYSNRTNEKPKPLEKIHTPNCKTVEEVSTYLNVSKEKIVKTMLYQAKDKIYACLIRGDREINELKLTKALHVEEVTLVEEKQRKSTFSVPNGFIGPIQNPYEIIMDDEVSQMKNFVTGANEKDFHYQNVNVTDFQVKIIADIKTAKNMDLCPSCQTGHLQAKKGIEIGNLFKLGTKYAEALDLQYLDEENQLHPVIMGSYGIGIGRIMAAIAEQNWTEQGIQWPMEIAPYQVGIIPVSMEDQRLTSACEKYHEQLEKEHIDVLYDDRMERFGVKAKDMELIGIPIRIIFGKYIEEGKVEVKTNQEKTLIPLPELVDYIKKITKIG